MYMNVSSTGRCADCGFLGFQWKGKGKDPRHYEIFEVPHDLRSLPPDELDPVCVRGLARLTLEGTVYSGDTDDPDNAVFAYDERMLEEGREFKYSGFDGAVTRAILRFQRQCPGWMRYQPGLSPAQHVTEFRIDTMHTDSMRVAEENAALARSGHELAKEMRFLTWVIVALTLITVLIAIITNSPSPQPISSPPTSSP